MIYYFLLSAFHFVNVFFNNVETKQKIMFLNKMINDLKEEVTDIREQLEKKHIIENKNESFFEKIMKLCSIKY